MDAETIIRKNGRIELHRQYKPYYSREILKENDLKPHLVEEWCIPKEQSADFAACMEDVLEVYSRPYDEHYPVVGMDEKPLQLLAHARKGYRKKNGTMIQE